MYSIYHDALARGLEVIDFRTMGDHVRNRPENACGVTVRLPDGREVYVTQSYELDRIAPLRR